MVQTVSGQVYASYIQQHIVPLLGMHHAAIGLAATRGWTGLGHRYSFGIPTATAAPFPQDSLPSGTLIASVEDMTHSLIAQLSEGRYHGATVMSAVGIATLHRPTVVPFEGKQYAMGWFVGTSRVMPVVWHNGTVPGFKATMVLAPVRRGASAHERELAGQRNVQGGDRQWYRPCPVRRRVVSDAGKSDRRRARCREPDYCCSLPYDRDLFGPSTLAMVYEPRAAPAEVAVSVA